jgi:hypothetical protein
VYHAAQRALLLNRRNLNIAAQIVATFDEDIEDAARKSGLPLRTRYTPW